MTHLTVGQITRWAGGVLRQGSADCRVSGVAWDSRQVQPGRCFVALRGANVDGHRFAAAAALAGASCLLVKDPVAAPPSVAVVQVPDPLLALGSVAAAWRRQFAVTVVGITGSIGKTTTKELTAAVLRQRYNIIKNPGNQNSEVGLPATLLNYLQPDAQGAVPDAAVLEMAMRALGEIRYLAAIAGPRVAIVTNVTDTHLELLGSIENIARAKAELVAAVPADGWAILNADDPRVRAMAAQCSGHVIFYGEKAAPGVRLTNWRSRGLAGQTFDLLLPPGPGGAPSAMVPIKLPVPGRHIAGAALAAAAAGRALGVAPGEIARGLASYTPAGQRLNIRVIADVQIIDDTYNAAPPSMAAALEVLKDVAAGGRRVAVLGDMYELGEAADAGHRAVGLAAAAAAHILIAVGERARLYADSAVAAGMAAENVRFFSDKRAAAAFLAAVIRAGDTVLFKGSRGLKMETLVAALQQGLEEPRLDC